MKNQILKWISVASLFIFCMGVTLEAYSIAKRRGGVKRVSAMLIMPDATGSTTTFPVWNAQMDSPSEMATEVVFEAPDGTEYKVYLDFTDAVIDSDGVTITLPIAESSDSAAAGGAAAGGAY